MLRVYRSASSSALSTSASTSPPVLTCVLACCIRVQVHLLGHADGDGGSAGQGGGLSWGPGGAGRGPPAGASGLRSVQRHRPQRVGDPAQWRPDLHRQAPARPHRRPHCGSAGEGGDVHGEEGWDAVRWEAWRRKSRLVERFFVCPPSGRQADLACPGNQPCPHHTSDVHLLKTSCHEFLHSGLRYQHLSPPSPELDYVAIRVELRERDTRAPLEVPEREAFSE